MTTAGRCIVVLTAAADFASRGCLGLSPHRRKPTAEALHRFGAESNPRKAALWWRCATWPRVAPAHPPKLAQRPRPKATTRLCRHRTLPTFPHSPHPGQRKDQAESRGSSDRQRLLPTALSQIASQELRRAFRSPGVFGSPVASHRVVVEDPLESNRHLDSATWPRLRCRRVADATPSMWLLPGQPAD